MYIYSVCTYCIFDSAHHNNSGIHFVVVIDSWITFDQFRVTKKLFLTFNWQFQVKLQTDQFEYCIQTVNLFQLKINLFSYRSMALLYLRIFTTGKAVTQRYWMKKKLMKIICFNLFVNFYWYNDINLWGIKNFFNIVLKNLLQIFSVLIFWVLWILLRLGFK